MCTAAYFSWFSGSNLQIINVVFLIFFADESCPKPPEIANGYVEHSVRYQCKTYYRLRTDGDGKTRPVSPHPPFCGVSMMNRARDDWPESSRVILGTRGFRF